MGLVNGGDKILWIEQNVTSVSNILRPDWVHMMD